jgi:rhodanese-related sulfurtransferase
VAQFFEKHGFKDVHPLVGGFEAWQDANLPVEPK